MNSFIVEKSVNRVADIEKIFMWLYYTPLGQTLTKTEKRVLASYISIYLSTKTVYQTSEIQEDLVNSYVFGAEASRLVMADSHIKAGNLQVVKKKLKDAKCILTNKDGNHYISKEVIPTIENNGDIIIYTTLRFTNETN